MEEYRTFGVELDDGVATTLLQKLEHGRVPHVWC